MDYTLKHAFLELGSTSIKFYIQGPEGVESQTKVPWDLGYDVFEHQRISPRSIGHCLSTLKTLRREHPEVAFSGLTAVGTAALREAQNVDILKHVLRDELGIEIHIIAGGIEAFLLETGYRDRVESYPTALFDLGGGSLELIEYLSPVTTRKSSIPMGAIRLHCQLRRTRDFFEYIERGRRLVERCYREHLSPLQIDYPEIIGTGGTVRAVAKCLGADSFTVEDVSSLIDREVHGPVWESLEPHRRRLLLPGLLALEGLYATVGVRRILHRSASVKSGLITLTSLIPRDSAGVRSPTDGELEPSASASAS